jgi:hypothetical protein
MRCKTFHILLLLKTAIFIGLSAVFYIFYFTTVAQKYAEGHTTVVVSQERMGNGKKFPFLTLCMTPCAKSRGFLLRQLWIINYYVKYLSKNC